MKSHKSSIELPGLKIVYAAFSDTGMVRKHNEDDFLILPESNLFCVADGVGGLKSGELASKSALESIKTVVGTTTNNLLRNSISSILIGNSLLEQIFQTANSVVYEKTIKLSNKMATTLAVVSINNRKSYIAHVGDSRVYLYRNEGLKQVTRDHSLVAELIENGSISQEQARNHPRRNVITRALGAHKSVTPSIQRFRC
jgi:serine/threonine protein phosphatase PrpC